MIRVFPRRTKWTPTDNKAIVGDPNLFAIMEIEKNESINISCTFTWDINECQRLKRAWSKYFDDVRVGGPAFDDPGNEFIPGRFIKNGVSITSRGCPFNCPWCFVPRREGKIRELPIMLGHIIQDNNLLACSQGHIKKVFKMLETQKGIVFSGGLDSRLIKPWHIEAINNLSIKEMWFACDTIEALPNLEKVANLTHHIPRYKKRCYVLIGYDFDESIEDAERRFKLIYELGFMPFAQVYQDIDVKRIGREWKTFARIWSRPAAYKILMASSGLR